jgi:GAF domain-containing protein
MSGPFAHREQIRSAAGFPLLYSLQTVGVLFVSYRSDHRFSPKELEHIRAAARKAADLVGGADIWPVLRQGVTKPRQEEERTLRAVANVTFNVLNTPVAIWTLQQDGQSLRISASTGLAAPYVTEASATQGDGGSISWVFENDKPLELTDLRGDRHFRATGRFQLGARSPAASRPLESQPRQEGGLTRELIETGKPIRIDDTTKISDSTPGPRVRHEVVEDGIRSLVGVKIQMEEERIGVLYVNGTRPAQFTDHHVALLQTLADQASVALGRPRLLLKASTEIERALARLFHHDKELKQIMEKVRTVGRPRFDFAALQLIHPRERVIETVCGVGRAADWEGRAKHYLEPVEQLRDIQADIFLAKTPRVEVITRKDPLKRFDEWIVKTFRHDKFVRALVPLVLVRDVNGKVLEGQDLEDTLREWRAGPWVDADQPEGRRQAAKLAFLKRSARKRRLTWEVIGTVEAGYGNYNRKTIRRDQAVSLAKSAARIAPQVYRTLLQHVFQTVVDYALKIVGAKYASLHFDLAGEDAKRPGRLHYVYEVFSGQVAKNFPRDFPPRKGGLGERAIAAGRALFMPDPSQGHNDFRLKRENPHVYAKGIRAMAAIPLLARPARETRSASEDDMSGSGQGVIYVGFGVEPGGGPAHHFTSEEINWLELFAASAADAIRHATAYTQMRHQARLLANLHSVGERLVSIPEDHRLLDHIAWSALNILGADVVTIYECQDSRVLARPAIAGRLS